MIKNDIALAIEKNRVQQGQPLLIVESILTPLKTALARNEKVEIRGFGSFPRRQNRYGRTSAGRNRSDRKRKAHQVPSRPGAKNLLSKTRRPERALNPFVDPETSRS
jgi:nucleoid DNA-binding protein